MVRPLKVISPILKEKNLDGLIVSSPFNISYLTGYRSRDSFLLLSEKEKIYFTDSRYLKEARAHLKDISFKKINGSVFKVIAKVCQKLKLKKVGFEERHLSFAEYKKIKEFASGITLSPTYGIIEELRQIKNTEELKRIRKAVEITVKALKFIPDFISPGRREAEIAGELQRFIRLNGADASAFEIIVASGPNSSFPHHLTSQRKIEKNEPVLLDIGVDYLGYKSDLTRVYFSGKINSLIRKIYHIVCQAQEKALNKIKPGLPANKIDALSRGYIARKGYGRFFGHNLGHGVGLEVHELPRIGKRDQDKLKPGMVFTVEPGIYLPGKFGLRLEDMVLVTEKGFKWRSR